MYAQLTGPAKTHRRKVSVSTKVCLVQLDVSPSKPDNLGRVLSSIKTAGEDCDLIAFPEYCMGYPREEPLTRKYVEEIAEPLKGQFISAVAECSKQAGVAAVVPVYERDDGFVYNTAVVINQGKVLGGYRKVHLFDALGYRESDMFRAGSSPFVFTVGGMKLGLVICYDIRFPELIRAEAMSGAQAVIAPSAWVTGPLKEEQWQALLMARAQENTSYMIGVGNANRSFIGRSAVVDPLGVKVLDLGSGDRLGFCEVDDNRVTKAREMLPVLKQAASTVYGPCVQV
jgi:predicted amidohydrolase